MMEDVQSKDKCMDDFWDIESLLPAKAPLSRPVKYMSTEAVEIEFDTAAVNHPSGEAPAAAQKLPVGGEGALSAVRPSQGNKNEGILPTLVYSPDHPLISEVRIYPWRSSFRFYERFCHIADALFERGGQPCQPVPFFSYMPQYDQMSRSQLDWYLYWRDCVRKGEYPDTDYSYIFLYLFEIINLSNRISPSQGQRMMCDIWRHYKKTYPLLNRYLSDWICDYSLIHQLAPPVDVLADVLPVLVENTTFKEFFACPSKGETGNEAHIYLTFCSNYSYKKSKLYLMGSEQAAAMDEHIPGALSAVIRALSEQDTAFSRTRMQKATLNRDSFIGALCSGDMKKRIEVDYCSFNRSHELRFLVTDMVKYTENRLRTVFGMKSRLSIYGLPAQVEAALNTYLDEALPSKRRIAVQERPAYEALYDAPTTLVSPEHAKQIERDSWEVTRQLVEAFEEEAPPTPVIEPAQEPLMTTAVENSLSEALVPYADLLRAIDHSDAARQQSACRAMGKMMDALAEEINVLATDIIGDILLEDNGNGYAIIEDYRSEITALLNE